MATGFQLDAAPSGRLRSAELQARRTAEPYPSTASLFARAQRAAAGLATRPGGMVERAGRRPEPRVPIRFGLSRAVLGLRRAHLCDLGLLSDRHLAYQQVTARSVRYYRLAYTAFTNWAARQNLSVSLEHLDASLGQFLLRVSFDGNAPFQRPPRVARSQYDSAVVVADRRLFQQCVAEHRRYPVLEEALNFIAQNFFENEKAA